MKMNDYKAGDVFRRGTIFNRSYVIIRMCTTISRKEVYIVGDLAFPDGSGWVEFTDSFAGKWIGNALRSFSSPSP